MKKKAKNMKFMPSNAGQAILILPTLYLLYVLVLDPILGLTFSYNIIDVY